MQKITADSPDAKSADIVSQNLHHLRTLFPDAWVEGKVDFDVLRQLLGGAVDDREEKFGLNWHGKRKARQLALTPSTGTLRPCPKESVEWDTTHNIMIEGDNLEVLKLLQKSYSGKVKLIYIDPPYNTGKDFIYPDDYQDNIKNYLELTGQVKGDKKMVANTEASGRFHTDWLNMMLPRLRLARNLLRDDGLIFISINDIEIGNVITLCNEVFGETNHIATFIWVNEGNIDNQSRIKVNHEYIVAFAKDEKLVGPPPVVDPNIPKSSKIFREDIENTVVQNGPANPISLVKLPTGFPTDFPEGKIDPKEDFWPKLDGTVKVTDGKTINPVTATSGWKCKGLLEEFISNNFNPIVDGKGQETIFYLTNTGAIFYKKRRLENPSHVLTVLRGMGTVQAESARLAKAGISFPYPKPTNLVEYLIKVGSSTGDLVLDFFAGSGTTGEASMRHGASQSGRRFILVQLPDKIGGEEVETIDKLAEKRLRHTAKEIRDENSLLKCDLGFRVYKLDSSNIREWDPKRDDMAASLDEHAEHLKSGRTEEDILTELLLKLGIDLCVPIESRKISDVTVYSIGAGTLFACLPEKITRAQIKPLGQGILAWRQELKVAVKSEFVFRDSAFADDVAKTNLSAYLEQNLPETQRGRIRSL